MGCNTLDADIDTRPRALFKPEIKDILKWEEPCQCGSVSLQSQHGEVKAGRRQDWGQSGLHGKSVFKNKNSTVLFIISFKIIYGEMGELMTFHEIYQLP